MSCGKVKVISNTKEASAMLEKIIQGDHNIVALGTEFGRNPSDATKTELSTIQINCSPEFVIILDVLQNPEILRDKKLKTLLESMHITKVIFFPEYDSKLFWKCGIKLQNVFDPQTLHLVCEAVKQSLPTRKLGNRRKRIEEICRIYDVDYNVNKTEVKSKLKDNPSLFLERSPENEIPQDIVDYAAEDVRCLLPLHDKIKKELENKTVKGKYKQILEECMYSNLKGFEDADRYRRQKKERDYFELRQFIQRNGKSGLTKGDIKLLRRGDACVTNDDIAEVI